MKFENLRDSARRTFIHLALSFPRTRIKTCTLPLAAAARGKLIKSRGQRIPREMGLKGRLMRHNNRGTEPSSRPDIFSPWYQRATSRSVPRLSLKFRIFLLSTAPPVISGAFFFAKWVIFSLGSVLGTLRGGYLIGVGKSWSSASESNERYFAKSYECSMFRYFDCGLKTRRF